MEQMLTTVGKEFLTNRGTGVYPPLVQTKENIDTPVSKECSYSPQLCQGCNEEAACAEEERWVLQEALNGRR